MRRLILTFLVTAVATIAAPRAHSGIPPAQQTRPTLEDYLWPPPADQPEVAADVDGEVQDMGIESILDEIDHGLVLASNRTGDRDVAPVRRGLWSLLRTPFAIVHAETQETASPLRMLVTSLGVSTGAQGATDTKTVLVNSQ